MHITNTAKAAILPALLIFLFSCEKSEQEKPVEPEIVSSIGITMDVQKIQPYYISFNEGFIGLAYLALDKHGKGRIEFAGKDGRNIATTVKERFDDYKSFHLSDGDTIKIYNDNKLTRLFITAKKNFAVITFPSPYTDSNETGVEMLNQYINNTLSTQKFSFRER
ncbi:hypothetical protein [Pollutibacter soli]|uniref:hypothetical protein n=1 Tax=Pollutibacter soli TaxID=3034157 RepID=UPI003013E4A9